MTLYCNASDQKGSIRSAERLQRLEETICAVVVSSNSFYFSDLSRVEYSMSQQEQAGSLPSAISLAASVRVLTFEPGVYRVSFTPYAHDGAPGEAFVAFPCARIDAPPGGGAGRAMIA